MYQHVEIHGVSDDLVEIRGAVEDEVMLPYDHDDFELRFGDGTEVDVAYGADGPYWTFDIVEKGDAASFVLDREEELDYLDDDVWRDYSEVAVVVDDDINRVDTVEG